MISQEQSFISQDWFSIIQQLAKKASAVWKVELIDENLHKVTFLHLSTDEQFEATIHLENPDKPIELDCGLKFVPTFSTAIMWIDTPGSRYPIQDGEDESFIGALNALSRDALENNQEAA